MPIQELPNMFILTDDLPTKSVRLRQEHLLSPDDSDTQRQCSVDSVTWWTSAMSLVASVR